MSRSAGSPKPTVLLVDDHRGVLDAVSAVLADDFDVAGVATDGWQALETAPQLAPDVIVLDINMPGLDGFQTMQSLQQAGSQTPVVFLSLDHADERVGEAFGIGGRGYVVKSRAARDLATAINQVAAFFDLALRRGDAMCVIATADVREGLGRRLRARGWEVGAPHTHERYLVIDAAEALSRFMREGLPDADLLAKIAAELDQCRTAVAEGPASRLTIFGNMVVPLSRAGNAEAVIALERLWNTLTYGLPFLTLCGYSTSCFHDSVSGLWSKTCDEHWAVSHATNV